MKVIKIINMNKSYQDNIIFDKFNFEVEENTFNVVMGVSGSGKSTLLNIIGLLDKADSGDVILFGEKNIKPFSRKAEKMLREKIGYLFQNFALVENETVEYNLKLALDNIKADKKEKIKEKKKKTQYWAADSNANKIAPLTYPEAKLRISTGENILCENQIAAYAIVKPYYRGKRPEPEIHKGEGYYWHYHINMKNHGAPHIWFQGEPYI